MLRKVHLVLLITAITNILLAQMPKGISLLPADSMMFIPQKNTDQSSKVELVSVNAQPFTLAHSVTCNANGNIKELNLRSVIKEGVKKDDVMLLSFYSRTISSKRETGLAFFEIGLDRFIDGKYNWPPLLERGMSFGKEWTQTQIPFKAAMDIKPGDLALIIRTGKMEQVFEIADVSLINYQRSIDVSSLPRSVVHYDGDAPDAAWRKDAEERIEKYRKGNLTIKVVDKDGKPVTNAAVTVNMTKSAFAWGTSTDSKIITDTVSKNAKIYRDTLLKYFNKVVLENEMKTRNWYRFNPQKTNAGIEWFEKHHISVRGHVMIWPSWEHSPHLLKYKDDTAALRRIILQQIYEQTTAINGRFGEWDVINEPFAHHEIIDALGGKEVMLEWFAAAQKCAPNVKLFLNEYTMFHGKDAGSEVFYNTIKYLLDNKAPLAAIGEQAHIGGTPPSINYILERLDHFSIFKLPIQISEFDITSDDDDFKARYMHDFMTAVFSHPSVIGFIQWGFWESAHWIPAGALWDKNWNIRPHGKVFTELVTKTWSTNESGKTNNSGFFSTRAFNGEYEVVVKSGNKKSVQHTTLDVQGQTMTITLLN